MCEWGREKWGSREIEGEGEERDVYELRERELWILWERERERAVKDVRKEEKGLRGSSLVWVFLTKKMGGFNDVKGWFGNKDELIWDEKRADLGGEMQ